MSNAALLAGFLSGCAFWAAFAGAAWGAGSSRGARVTLASDQDGMAGGLLGFIHLAKRVKASATVFGGPASAFADVALPPLRGDLPDVPSAAPCERSSPSALESLFLGDPSLPPFVSEVLV